MPERIKRGHPKSGYVLPPDVVDCTRPGKFGNPFRVTPTMDAEGAVDLFSTELDDALERQSEGRRGRDNVQRHFDRIATDLPEIRDRDCACYCSPDTPHCHLVPLMAAANR